MHNGQSPRPGLAVVWFMENEVSCQIRSRNVPPPLPRFETYQETSTPSLPLFETYPWVS